MKNKYILLLLPLCLFFLISCKTSHFDKPEIDITKPQNGFSYKSENSKEICYVTLSSLSKDAKEHRHCIDKSKLGYKK